MRILVVDSDPIGTDWIGRLLSGMRGYELAGMVTDARNMVKECRRTGSHVVLVSGSHPAESLAVLGEVSSAAAVVVVWGAASGSSVWASLEHGVSAAVLRDRLADELRPALATIEAGGVYLSPSLALYLPKMSSGQFRRHAHIREVRRRGGRVGGCSGG